MSEHPPTSIGIEYDRQDYDSRLSSRTESLKIIGVAQQKQSLFYHQVTQLFYRIIQKHDPIKKIIPRLINLQKILKQIFNNQKHTKIRITQIIMINLLPIHQIIILPKRISQAQVTKKMIRVKKQQKKRKTSKFLWSFTF